MIAKIIIILAVGILIGAISFILKINRRPYKEWRDGKKSKPYNEIFPEVKKTYPNMKNNINRQTVYRPGNKNFSRKIMDK